MIKLSTMCMVGSAGANAGKTTLICALLRKFSKNHDIVGIKVTIKGGESEEDHSDIDHISSDENFCIIEETVKSSNKDTARFLAAGAFRAFWLKSTKTSLAKGMKTLFKKIESNSILICESNSLRYLFKPGIFLMVENPKSKTWKSSSQQLKKYADRIGAIDECGLNALLEQINLVDGKWQITKNRYG